MDKLICVSDYQAKYVNWSAHRAVLKFARDFQPQTVVVNGDLVDLESISKYPATLQARQSLLEDLRAAEDVLAQWRATVDQARIVLVEGNHEARLQKYLTRNAPELEGLPGLTIPELLHTDEHGVEYVGPYGKGLSWHSVYIYHGSVIRKESAYSAAAELKERWTSGVTGHTQRLGSHFFTDGMGIPHQWVEGGCMTTLEPSRTAPAHMRPKQQNWQNGFVVGMATEDGWNLYPIMIYNDRFRVPGYGQYDAS
jgi:hypothetical protein